MTGFCWYGGVRGKIGQDGAVETDSGLKWNVFPSVSPATISEIFGVTHSNFS
jgi:hypothetical protein